MIRYTIKLTKLEVEELKAIISKGSHSSQTFKAAYILLNCDQGKYSEKVTNEEICKILKVGMRTIDRVKKKMVEEGFGKQYALAALTPDDPKTIKLKQEWMAKHAPVLESLRMSAYPNLPAIGGSSTGTGSLAQQAAAEKAKADSARVADSLANLKGGKKK